MAITPFSFTLDSNGQTIVDLWHAASDRLTTGPESDDILVQAAEHTIVAWLRHDATTPAALLEAFSGPGGPLVPQLRFVGSLIHDPTRGLPDVPPRLWWWVVAAAYYRRWRELSQSQSPTSQPPGAGS